MGRKLKLAPSILNADFADLRSAVVELRDRGTAFLSYEGIDQDDQGVWTTPNGDLVAWFHDPDLNVLSLTELGKT